MRSINKNILNAKGFTLIELLIAMSIVGILASLALANYSTTQARSRDIQRKTDLKVVREALENYKVDKGSYPNKTQAGAPLSTAAKNATLATAAYATQFSTTLMSATDTTSGLLYFKYMSKAVKDPKSTYTYRYAPTNAAGDEYTLEACLEINNDSASYQAAAFGPCTTSPASARYNYRVFNP